LHVLHKLFGVFDRIYTSFQRLVVGGAQLVADVHVGHAQPGVDAGMGSILQRLGGGVNVFPVGPCQATNDTVTYLSRDALHRSKVPWRRNGKTSLDDVYPHLFQCVGDFDLFADVKRCPRRLLPIAQGGVKDDDAVGCR
jgi:hypothetical protein